MLWRVGHPCQTAQAGTLVPPVAKFCSCEIIVRETFILPPVDTGERRYYVGMYDSFGDGYKAALILTTLDYSPKPLFSWIPAFAGMTGFAICHSRESGNPLRSQVKDWRLQSNLTLSSYVSSNNVFGLSRDTISAPNPP
jgi:hypothetical protein